MQVQWRALGLFALAVALVGWGGWGPEEGLTGLTFAMAGFGAPFRAMPGAAVDAAATPPSGHSEEAIWHQLYDTQTYVDATTLRLNFFVVTQADPTLSNLPTGGQLPDPQKLQIHNITCDILSVIPLTASDDVTGVLNDLALLIFGSNQRPTWTLSISQKPYGPYSLTVLHGTGGPAGWGWAAGATADASFQYGRNDPGPGWNYFGRVIIPQRVNFNVALDWAAVADTTADKRVRISLFGVLNRRVL